MPVKKVAAKKKAAKKTVAKKRLTKNEKRILIAKDVLRLLKDRPKLMKVTTSSGYFHNVELTENAIKSCKRYDRFTTLLKVSPDKQLNKSLKSCEVCAMGAMFVASVDRSNHLKLGELYKTHYTATPNTIESDTGRDTIEKRLEKLFSHDELDVIEANFENGDEVDPSGVLTPKQRLRAIMRQIIKNNGAIFDKFHNRLFVAVSKKS